MAEDLHLGSNDFASVRREAERLALCGNHEKAKSLYTQFIKQGKDSRNLALARNNRGHLKYLQVDFDGAIEDYTKALEINPNLAVSYYNRGQIHYRMGRFRVAIEDFLKAVELDPGFDDARESLQQAKEDSAQIKR